MGEYILILSEKRNYEKSENKEKEKINDIMSIMSDIIKRKKKASYK